jgi:hypothetical protein
MLIYVRNGRLEQLGHVSLSQPDALMFQADADPRLAGIAYRRV